MSGTESAVTEPRPFSLGRWTGFVVAGESLGFLAPTAGFAAATTADLGPWAAYALLIALGSVEGVLLALGQAAGLRGTRGQVPLLPWVTATAAGAALAWSLGMLPSTLMGVGVPVDVTQAATWALLAPGALMLLSAIPVAQWIVLRRTLPRAWRWIPLGMAAWLAGLVFTLLPGPFVDATTPTPVLVISFVGAGVAMATTVAVLTGLGLRGILAAGVGVRSSAAAQR